MDKIKSWLSDFDNWRNLFAIAAISFMVLGWVQTVQSLPARVTNVENEHAVMKAQQSHTDNKVDVLIRIECAKARSDTAMKTTMYVAKVDCANYLNEPERTY